MEKGDADKGKLEKEMGQGDTKNKPNPKCKPVSVEIKNGSEATDKLSKKKNGKGVIDKATTPPEDNREMEKLEEATRLKEKTATELEKLVKGFHAKKSSPKVNEVKKKMVSKLEEARQELVSMKWTTRRKAWKEEIKKGEEEREEFRRKMDSTPLEEVTDGKDKQTMSKMNRLWRFAYGDDRTTFLFHEVFLLLHRFYGDRKAFVNENDILSCRKVCRGWRTAIDTRLSAEFSKPEWNKKHVEVWLPSCSYTFPALLKVQRFIYWGQVFFRGSNPFFNRKLELGSGSAAVEWKDNQEYWSEMGVILRKWGKEIWQVNIRFDDGMSGRETYELLVKSLKLLPNLKFLGLYPHDMDRSTAMHNGVAMHFIDWMDGKDWSNPMKARMAENPLPDMPQLKHILFNYTFDLSVMRALMSRYSDRLESITLDRQWMEPVDFFGTVKNTFPVLKKLTAVCQLDGMTIPGSNFSCPCLEEGFILYRSLKDPVDVEGMFGNMNKFGSSCKTLSMTWAAHGETTRRATDNLPMFLELPKVELLLMVGYESVFSNIDFLLPCSSLKTLYMAYQKKDDIFPVPVGKRNSKTSRSSRSSSKTEIIQFAQYTERLYESNIWKLLPDLRRVSIDFVTMLQRLTLKEAKNYTREGYLEHCKGEGKKSNR